MTQDEVPNRWDGVRLAAVTDRLIAPVAVIDRDSTFRYVNPAAAHTVGQQPAWLVGRAMLELVHPEDRGRVERLLREVSSGRPSGGVTTYRFRADDQREWRVFESIADNLLDDPDVGGILISTRDITEQTRHAEQLSLAAYTDPLTGLANRTKLAEEIRARLLDSDDFGVAFVGVDRYPAISASVGPVVADSLLRTVAGRIAASVPPEVLVARVSGGSFGLLLPSDVLSDTRALLSRLIARLSEPAFPERQEISLSASVGLTFRDAIATTDSLLGDAAFALHGAQQGGGRRIDVADASHRGAALARLELESDLRRAIERDELHLALQPIVRLSDRTTVHSEALLRWQRAGVVLSPSDFIPLAENTGLILPIGRWVLERAAFLASHDSRPVAVNLSPRQLAAPGLPQAVRTLLAAYGLPPESVAFELTETLLIEDFDHTVEVIRAIRDLGCRVGLDDFGTGYSSLSYLRRLPIDFLKIDRSLVAEVDSEADARAIVAAVVAMAGGLRLDVIAEGVETETQAETLIEIGCTYGQGYLFGRPDEHLDRRT